MPTWMVAERAILQTLVKQGPNSYTSALQAVPRTMRSMYMHAWQSWCWNTAVSERIRRYGPDKVVAGDLVLPPSAAAAGSDGGVEMDGTAADAAADGAQAGTAAAAEAAGEGGEGTAAEVEGSSAAARLAAVHVVTAEEAAQGKYSMADVVLPMPGGQVQYPQHAAGWEFYCRLAAEDGIMLPGETDAEYDAAVAAVAAAAAAAAGEAADGAANAAAGGNADAVDGQPAAAIAAVVAKPRQHSVKEFQLSGLSGDYRKVLHVPTSLQHRVVRYTDLNQPDLLPSDLTDLAARQQQQQAKQAGTEPQQQQKRPLVAEDGQQEQGQQQSKRQKVDGQQQQGGEAGASQQQQGGEAGGSQQQQQGSQPGSVQPADAMDVDQAPSADIQAAAAAAAVNGSSGPAAATAAGAVGGGGAGSSQQERVGVILEFTLSSSCYATMLIRELTKQSTSKAAHKQLSAQQPGSANGAQ
jgi:tRNA(Glu) U13 pseudouridine synthase TruD